jgi:quinol-cytochrome oxidoreductase complex cytochrome b subunit
MLIYYVPLTDNAYSSTMYIIKNVPLGHLIETFHLYNAYAMIVFTFAHFTRNYFLSVQKKPRELMWMVGFIMGFMVLGFGLTGYLLPWTVVSKAATDVAVGMLSLIPGRIGLTLKFLIAGTGGDQTTLRRFVNLHTVIFPSALLALLALKLYMFEVHKAAPIAYIKKRVRVFPWFPKVFSYLLMISSVYLSFLFAITALFPLSLPPEFSPAIASKYITQPDWYFLWVYQILKFSIFEGTNVEYALAGIVTFLMILFLLPFIDKGIERNPALRPLYTSIGVVILITFITLSIWGYLTPGQVIPISQAVIIMGGLTSATAILTYTAIQIRKHALTYSEN